MELYGTLYESFGIVTEILSKLVTILSGTLFFSSLSTKGCCILIKTNLEVCLEGHWKSCSRTFDQTKFDVWYRALEQSLSRL